MVTRRYAELIHLNGQLVQLQRADTAASTALEVSYLTAALERAILLSHWRKYKDLDCKDADPIKAESGLTTRVAFARLALLRISRRQNTRIRPASEE